MKMFLISDNFDTLTGMRLVGVDGVVAHTGDEVKSALDTAYNDKEVGILLITEKLGLQYSDMVNAIKLNHSTPIIIEIPDRHGTGRRKDFITSFVSEAVGLKL